MSAYKNCSLTTMCVMILAPTSLGNTFRYNNNKMFIINNFILKQF